MKSGEAIVLLSPNKSVLNLTSISWSLRLVPCLNDFAKTPVPSSRLRLSMPQNPLVLTGSSENCFSRSPIWHYGRQALHDFGLRLNQFYDAARHSSE